MATHTRYHVMAQEGLSGSVNPPSYQYVALWPTGATTGTYAGPIMNLIPKGMSFAPGATIAAQPVYVCKAPQYNAPAETFPSVQESAESLRGAAYDAERQRIEPGVAFPYLKLGLAEAKGGYVFFFRRIGDTMRLSPDEARALAKKVERQ